MKTITLALVGLGVIGGIIYYTPSTTTFEAVEREVIEKEIEVDSIEKRIADAQAEAMADIEAKANEMRDQFIATQLDEVESQVLGEIQAELKSRQIETDKRTGAF